VGTLREIIHALADKRTESHLDGGQETPVPEGSGAEPLTPSDQPAEGTAVKSEKSRADELKDTEGDP
jgi:hypothetical protein